MVEWDQFDHQDRVSDTPTPAEAYRLPSPFVLSLSKDATLY
jgi:hypothetical protein